MTENAQDKLRQGLDLLWKGLDKEKKEHCSTPHARGYIEKAEAGLNQAEQLLGAGRVRDAAEVAIKASNLLTSIDFRCGIALFRESNEMQKESMRKGKIKDMKQAGFFARTTKLLDQAESLLDEGKTEEARRVLLQYHSEKVKVGLAGPVGF